ncbi:hypothetical protein PR048_004451 [Dryococelus australis]|uniref:Uncharacterized protein n=1 Tax=Dryococelus australis TaxID=614101 RepID=A0ABQ9I6H3_9NEOP|nr:hypothetical protein PR048_004451 [Dryococelus australis]
MRSAKLSSIILGKVTYVSVTCDLWSSRVGDSFLTIWFYPQTRWPAANTAENIAAEVSKISEDWNLEKKVCCIVTDKTLPVIESASPPMFCTHFECDGSRCIENSICEQENKNKTPLKLLQEVPTRWNSTLQMIKRVVEINNNVVVLSKMFLYEERTIPHLTTILDPRMKKEGFRSSENSKAAETLLQGEIAIKTVATAAVTA